MPEDGSLRIGVYVCSCGANIGSVISPAAVADYAARLDDVVLTRDNLQAVYDMDVVGWLKELLSVWAE